MAVPLVAWSLEKSALAQRGKPGQTQHHPAQLRLI
jgi:hypothetical protein